MLSADAGLRPADPILSAARPQAWHLIIHLQLKVLLLLPTLYCPGCKRLILCSCLKPGGKNPRVRGCGSPVLSQQASPWENVFG